MNDINIKFPDKDRTVWPFKYMELGQTIKIDANPRGQKYVHIYANQTGKRFKTLTMGGSLFVKRIA